ncbi:hypothetical protein HK104_001450 [Borealophlyctis nickersoniae]|nr:hypothetical protein HK104_001450 [Borealophlyctis nickersoniae]
MKVDGKVIIITGASSGFGKAIAERVAPKGAKLVLADIAEVGGKAVEADLNRRYPGNAVFVKCDVTNADDLKRVFEVAKRKFGNIDIVINNAGVLVKGDFPSDVNDTYLKAIDINVTAVIRGTRLAVTEMTRSGRGGVIVNTGSIAGLEATPDLPVYAATKGAVVHFTRSLSTLHPTSNIRVNAVCPSISPTNMFEDAKKTYKSLHRLRDEHLVPVSLVVDAFERAIEDESLAGACLSVTPKEGIQPYQWRRAKL